MRCLLSYCLYNHDFECILDKVQINARGMCTEYIPVSLEKSVLNEAKSKQFNEIEREIGEGK